MKKIMTLVLALMTAVSVAQYNNTYDVNGNGDNLSPSFVISNQQGESITVSFASDGPTLPRTDYFIVTKHDAFGTTLYNNRIFPFSSPTEGFTNVEALIQTDDRGVLVAGYFYGDDAITEQPFLTKLDVNGNHVWTRIYFVNQRHFESSQVNKISLCRVFDDDKEHYFIVASSDSDVNPGQDVVTNVIKVDDNGGMIFSRKYYNTNADEFTLEKDFPSDIEFSRKDRLYMITGYRIEANDESQADKMYYFGIDNNGNLLTPFLTLAWKSIPIDQDMVYDPERNVFATVFTHHRQQFMPDPPAPSYRSVIGFITVDAGLNIANWKYLWHEKGLAHNGRSISLCGDGPYLLCSGITDRNNPARRNPSFLKVDATGVPTTGQLIRYNVDDDVIFGHHATTFNPDSGDEEYVLVNDHRTDLRVIRPDFFGAACGDEYYDAMVEKYEPKQVFHKYYYEERGDYKRYGPIEKMLDPKYRKCDNDASSYRTTGIAQVGSAESGLLLYPSVISASNARLTLVNSNNTELSLEIRNITGQLVYSNKQVAAGKTEIKLSGNLSQGVYLVSIYNATGALAGTSKIIITE
jgi:hypothetical protein